MFSKSSKFVHTITSISGIIAPLLFIGLILIMGELESSYNHLTDTISALGGVQGPRRNIFRMGTIITGLFIITFGIGLHHSVNKGEGSKIGPSLIVISGIGIIGLAIFLHQNIGDPEYERSLDTVQILHLAFASISVSGANFATFFLYKRFKKDPLFENFAVFTLISGVLANLQSLFMAITILTNTLTYFKGLLEKLIVIYPLIWLITISIKLIMVRTHFLND